MGKSEEKMNRCSNPIQLNIGIGLYLVLFVLTVLIDWNLLFLGMGYTSALIVSIVLIGILIVLIRKKIHIQFGKVDVWDLVIVVFFLFITFLRIAIPDTSYDTLNYHLLFQESLQNDAINYDFFPGRVINQLYFCLGDRLFYIFRLFLGYRMGAIVNTIVFIILYFQTKQLLVLYVQKHNEKWELVKKYEKLLITILAFFAIYAEQMIWLLSTYYVDLLALPFLIEILRRSILCEEQTSGDFIIVGLMAGITVAIKPYNALWLAPLAVCFLARFYKNIKLWNVISVAISGISPSIAYIYLSFQTTGNPFFPYLNGVFKSEWWFTDKSVDEYTGILEYFGPENWKEYLLWPFYMLFKRDEIAFSDINVYNGKIFFACILMIGLIILVCMRKRIALYIQICFVFVCSYLLYITAGNGHLRYALFLEYLAGLVISGVVLHLMFKMKDNRERDMIYKLLGVCGCIVMLINISVISDSYINTTREYSWRSNYLTDKKRWTENAKYIFKDYEKDKIVIENLGAFLVFDTNAGMMKQINSMVPIINISCSAVTDSAKDKLNERLEQIDGELYTVSRIGALDAVLNSMQIYGYQPVLIEQIDMPKTMGIGSEIYLIKLEVNTTINEE